MKVPLFLLHSPEPVVNKAPMSAALLQPLPVNQVIRQSSNSNDEIPDPMRKYYFNVGKCIFE